MMFRFQAWLALCTLLSITSAALLSASPTSPTLSIPRCSGGGGSTTTPRPDSQPAGELRKRQDNTRNLCGTNEGGTGRTNFCVTTTDLCAATILPNGHAYQYCSNSAYATQEVSTTALSSWDSNKPCPTDARCCSDKASPAVKTILFIASDYTVTGWGCDKAEATYTFDPYAHLLDPPRFSASLAHLASATITSSAPPKHSASASPHSSNGGLSSGAVVGIGVGIGVGVGFVLVASIAFCCWRRRQSRKQTSTPAQSPYAEMEDPSSAYPAKSWVRSRPQEMDAQAYGLKGPLTPPPQELPG